MDTMSLIIRFKYFFSSIKLETRSIKKISLFNRNDSTLLTNLLHFTIFHIKGCKPAGARAEWLVS